MTQAVLNLASGFETLAGSQEHLDSVASSSQRRSKHALELVRRERAEREQSRRQFEEEISALRATLRDQLGVSKEAIAVAEQTKRELQAVRERSQALEAELLAFRRESHALASTSHMLSG